MKEVLETNLRAKKSKALDTVPTRWVMPLLITVIVLGICFGPLLFWFVDSANPTKTNRIVLAIYTALVVIPPSVAIWQSRQLRCGPLRVELAQCRRGLLSYVSLYPVLYLLGIVSLITVMLVLVLWSFSASVIGVFLIVMLAIWASVILFATRQIRMIFREADRVCPNCTYDRKGELWTPCPECGYAEEKTAERVT